MKDSIIALYSAAVKVIFGDTANTDSFDTPRDDAEGIFWGFLMRPFKTALNHLMVLGTTGSGKTLILRLFLQSIIPCLHLRKDSRVLIYNPKQEWHKLVHGMSPQVPVITLDPFDRRTVAWDLAEDITTEADAYELGLILIPEETNAAQRYFSDAARGLFTAVVHVLCERCPGKWDLRDVILALQSKTALLELLKSHEVAWATVETYFAEDKSYNSIAATIATKIAPYRTVAAIWSKATVKVSITSWLKSNSVLIVGQHPSHKRSVAPIVQAFFERLSQLILSQSESDTRRTFVVLDELRDAGKLTSLFSLFNQGRSKGCSVAIGLQGVEGFIESVQSKHLAHEIMGLCGSKTFLATRSQETANWIERHFGQVEVIEAQVSRGSSYSSKGGSTSSSNITYQKTIKSAILGSAFMQAPPTGPEFGLQAWHDVPGVGCYTTEVPWSWFKENLHPPANVLNELQQDSSKFRLALWTPDDLRRLSLSANSIAKVRAEQVKAEADLFAITREQPELPLEVTNDLP